MNDGYEIKKKFYISGNIRRKVTTKDGSDINIKHYYDTPNNQISVNMDYPANPQDKLLYDHISTYYTQSGTIDRKCMIQFKNGERFAHNIE